MCMLMFRGKCAEQSHKTKVRQILDVLNCGGFRIFGNIINKWIFFQGEIKVSLNLDGCCFSRSTILYLPFAI